jgi:hypothetical protein
MVESIKLTILSLLANNTVFPPGITQTKTLEKRSYKCSKNGVLKSDISR